MLMLTWKRLKCDAVPEQRAPYWRLFIKRLCVDRCVERCVLKNCFAFMERGVWDEERMYTMFKNGMRMIFSRLLIWRTWSQVYLAKGMLEHWNFYIKYLVNFELKFHQSDIPRYNYLCLEMFFNFFFKWYVKCIESKGLILYRIFARFPGRFL